MTAAAPFEPVGEIARWRIIYNEILADAQVGDVITWERMGDILDLHPVTDRPKILAGLKRAAEELLIERRRAIRNISNIGYRITDAEGQLEVARNHQRRAARQVQRGYDAATYVDLTGVEPAVRHAFMRVAEAFAAQTEFNRRLQKRQANIQQALSTLSDSQDRTEEKLAQLQARLDRLTGS